MSGNDLHNEWFNNELYSPEQVINFSFLSSPSISISPTEPSVLAEDDQQPARWERSPRSPDTSDIQTKGARKKKKKKEKEEKKKKEKSSRGRHSSRDCRVEKREMRVRDLGMGFDSDEIVLFKFCVGSCQRSRGNYDLALHALLANGSLPKRTARKVSTHPCCRPTGYEPVSFMDATTTWRTIKSLSAADCECMGWGELNEWRGSVTSRNGTKIGKE